MHASTWMRDSLHIIGDKTLFELTLPGSHNSASYKFTNKYMKGSQSGGIEFIIKHTDKLIGKTINKMEITQKLTIYGQLMAGARYLDIRAGWENEWRSYHCHIGDTIEDILNQVKFFIDRHECEIIILEISHFRGVNYKSHLPELDGIIRRILSDYVFIIEDEINSSVFDLVSANKRLFLIFPYGQRPWDFIKNTYPNKNELKKVIEYNDRKIKNSEKYSKKYSKKLLKISWILTPGGSDIFTPLLKIARKINQEMYLAFINHRKDNPKVRYGNLLVIDNFGYSEIMKMIYIMNEILN